MNGLLTRLYRESEWDLLRDIQSGKRTILDVFNSYKLHGKVLPNSRNVALLTDEVLTWLGPKLMHLPGNETKKNDRERRPRKANEGYGGCNEQTRELYRHYFRQLTALKEHARIDDLPSLVESYRDICADKGTHRQFNGVRNAVKSFITNTIRRSDPMYAKISDIPPLDESPAKQNAAVDLETIVAVLKKCDLETAKILWTLVTTGMGWLEYTNNFESLPDRILVHGTKMRRRDNRRDRSIPKVYEPAPPTQSQKLFRRRLKVASGDNLTPYELRNTYTYWVYQSCGLIEANQYTGHEAKSITEMYARPRLTDNLVTDAGKIRKYIEDHGIIVIEQSKNDWFTYPDIQSHEENAA
jgi:integrase